LWTKRWVELRPHEEQLRLWNDPARFKIVPAGRRSGKTELAKRRLVVASMVRKNPPGRYFAAAPTRDQAKRIWWNDLKALLPREWKPRISESDLSITTSTGAQLWVIGLDKPQRMEGTPWDGGVIDEYADTKVGTFDANIRPALADRKGWLWFIGVPDMSAPGQIEYEGFYQVAATHADPEWAAFSWASADILPAEEVESAKRRMDPRLFEQEMLGKFILAGGRAFPDFDPSIHASKPVPYDKSLPLCWSLDFNINPMCSGVIQHHKGEVRVIHEFALPDTKTDTACDTFLGEAQRQGWNLKGLNVYGDATGDARDSTSGITDWFIVKNRLKNVEDFRSRVPRSQPGIKDTVNAVNAKLKSADGMIHVAIDPSCHGLITDLRSALAGTDMEPQHHVSWFRYFCNAEFPVNVNRPPASGGIGFAASGL
jgi:hypothetical protein